MKFFIFAPLQHEYIHTYCLEYENIHIPVRNYGNLPFSAGNPSVWAGQFYVDYLPMPTLLEQGQGITKRGSL